MEESDVFLDAATQIGHRLCRDALWADARCTWLGDALHMVGGTWAVVHRTAGPELYEGTSGIALFLAALSRHTGERLHRSTAHGAMRHALDRAHGMPPEARLGLYSGWAGIAHASRAVADATAAPEIADEGRALLEELASRSHDDPGHPHDVLSGRAGAIPVLLNAHAEAAAPDLVALAVRCGDALIDAAECDERGCSWRAPGDPPAGPNLTGLSHGASGIAWALLELYAVTGDDRFRHAAEEGFRYERAWFDDRTGNWADLRSEGPQSPAGGAMVAWCHGAPGIGLARLRATELLEDPAYGEEADVAVRTTAAAVRSGMSARLADLSLCHGAAGNAELLLEADSHADDEARGLAEALGREAAQRFGDGTFPWPCGVPGGGETPGLMLGLAGIGYFFLRLHDRRATGSVLLLAVRG